MQKCNSFNPKVVGWVGGWIIVLTGCWMSLMSRRMDNNPNWLLDESNESEDG